MSSVPLHPATPILRVCATRRSFYFWRGWRCAQGISLPCVLAISTGTGPCFMSRGNHDDTRHCHCLRTSATRSTAISQRLDRARVNRRYFLASIRRIDRSPAQAPSAGSRGVRWTVTPDVLNRAGVLLQPSGLRHRGQGGVRRVLRLHLLWRSYRAGASPIASCLGDSARPQQLILLRSYG